MYQKSQKLLVTRRMQSVERSKVAIIFISMHSSNINIVHRKKKYFFFLFSSLYINVLSIHLFLDLLFNEKYHSISAFLSFTFYTTRGNPAVLNTDLPKPSRGRCFSWLVILRKWKTSYGNAQDWWDKYCLFQHFLNI